MEEHEEMFVVIVKEEPLESTTDEVTKEESTILAEYMLKNEMNNLDIINDPPLVTNCFEALEKFGKPATFVTLEKEKNRTVKRECLLKEVQCKSKSKKEQRIKKSFVDDLRRQYPEYADDEDKLVIHLAKIMKEVKVPSPPDSYAVCKDNKYLCAHCDKTSSSQALAAYHYAWKHGPRYLMCYSCGYSFRHSSNLYKHEKRWCRGLGGDNEIVLRARALATGHKGANRPYLHFGKETSAVLSKKSSCPLCQFKFTSDQSKIEHAKIHNIDRPFRCEECNSTYTRRDSLSKHMRIKHRGDKFQRFICDICGNEYSYRERFIKHLASHEKTSFKCNYDGCYRNFSTPSYLKMHIDRNHLNLPGPHACNICPKRFFKTSLLKLHMKKKHGLTLMTKTMMLRQRSKMSENLQATIYVKNKS